MKSLHKNKILFFIDWYLPGYKAGGPTRSMANMAEHLADYFDIYIVTRNTDYMSTTVYNCVESDKWNKLFAGERVYYIDEKKLSLGFYKELFRKEEFNIIYIHGVFSWKFSILPLIAAKLTRQKNIIVAPRGMLAPSAVDIKLWKKRLFLKLANVFGLYRNVTFHATNNKEKTEILQNTSLKTPVIVAENLPRKINKKLLPINKKKDCLKLVSLTRIAPEKNTLFAIDILTRIQNKKSVIYYDIYGQVYDEQYWMSCKKLIKQLPNNIIVQYKGTIPPEKLHETISQYHCLFLPTRGENFGHAILESLMAGRPVVISDKTPWQNLKKEGIGVDISLDKADKFVETIIMFIDMDLPSFEIWSNKAFDFAKKYCRATDIIEKYHCMFN